MSANPDEGERLAEAIETAGRSVGTGLTNLATAILEAATVYQFVQIYPKTDPVHTQLEGAIGNRLRSMDIEKEEAK